MNKIDVDSLREDLIDYFGTAMYNASPLAVIDLVKIERASDEEIIRIAVKNNFDLDKYMYDDKLRKI